MTQISLFRSISALLGPGRIKNKAVLLFLLCQLVLFSGFAQAKTTIEIKDRWYYLNGEKYFIKAIGYEIGARPGQNPYEGVRADDLDLMKFDLKVIKEGGYNTIRTWSQFTEPQLKLVQSSGLKLIMGIDIDPEKDYGDPIFIRECQEKLKRVMSYSKKYDCIITYLILNEPKTDHIHKVTGKAFVELMKNLTDIIHREHPGVPVTISANAMISDYIDENIFDVYAYNCYDHTEAQTATMGFKDYVKGLIDLNGDTAKPFICTEFGYSVSHKGYGRYGGNTLVQQSNGLIANYRDLIDAGATGMCPFYYADGWWKGGDANYHNADQPEEWFGFWGYSDINDKFGTPRPVWYAMHDYMKALIISPKNNNIYQSGQIPLELYTDKDVSKVTVKLNDKVLFSKNLVKEGYFADQLSISPKGTEDMELAFEFCDKENKVLKTESIMILASDKPIELPTLIIEVTPDKDLNDGKIACVKTKIQSKEAFKLADEVRVSFNTHLGWEVGEQATCSIKDQPDSKNIEFESFFRIPDNCWIVNASAGVSVNYGKCSFRIHDQKIIFRGDWAKDVERKSKPGAIQ
jgi:hypothetical protein